MNCSSYSKNAMVLKVRGYTRFLTHSCILICCDEHHVLGWYLCRYERAFAWEALMSRIAEPRIVVSDGGPGF